MPESVFGRVTSIGDLLSSCGAMEQLQVNVSKIKATQLGVTLGHYLLDEGLISVDLLRSVLICQTLLQRRLTTHHHVLQALNGVRGSKMSIDAALNSVGWNRHYYKTCAGITDLLVDSGALEEEVREALYLTCPPTEKPMLTLLVERKMVSDLVADAVLTLQYQVQTQALTRRQAVERLKQIVKADASGKRAPQVSDKIRLGEILVAAGAVTAVQLISSVERGRLLNREMGELLVADGVLPAQQLEEALRLLRQIHNSEVDAVDAIMAVAAMNQAPEVTEGSDETAKLEQAALTE
jgi:hypothetical protein